MSRLFEIWKEHRRENAPFFLISGPCVIESYEQTFRVASFLKNLTENLELPFIFKASYDKANRTSLSSFRGPGIERGLDILSKIRAKLNIAVMSDVHRVSEVELAADTLDVIQIPAFLCRQTDLLLEVAKTNKPINIKKGQFLAPWDIISVIDKVTSSASNPRVLITERGVMFGYNNLVVDFRGIMTIQSTGHPVVFDATHSVQLPGNLGSSSGGQREFIPVLARAAIAAGVDGIFMEVHENPDKALCDGPNSVYLSSLAALLEQLKNIRNSIN